MPGKILIVEDDVDIARLLGLKPMQDGHESPSQAMRSRRSR
jgi:hypothetical protein